MRFSRIGGAAAVGFAVTIATINLIMVPAGLPPAGTDAGRAAAFFAADGRLVGVASALAPLAWILATLFGAAAVTAVRESEQARQEAWSLVGFAGVLLQNLTFAGVIAARLALARSAGAGPQAAAALWAWHDAAFTLNGTFLAMALAGLSVAGLRAGLIRPWLAALGALAAVLQFTSACLAFLVIERAGPLGLVGLAGWLAWVVWLVAYGLRLAGAPAGPVQPGGPGGPAAGLRRG
ncbi:hypothetical protein Sru01_39060 [Sphaerisporangium rufum]|uniref:DUF4386 domain-containing protein n=2 Tax=Sphaerisporangium rufum TaxID=1381558 RepID=A0A919R3A8_9ACTN|nr:hypothetical protein Sru01_39060 [Sphaerisporangium rufum]